MSCCKRGERCEAYKRLQARHAKRVLELRTELDNADQALRISHAEVNTVIDQRDEAYGRMSVIRSVVNAKRK